MLLYSSAPQIVGLALRKGEVGSAQYVQDTRVVLAVIIPISYWVAGIGFLLAIPLLKRDLAEQTSLEGPLSKGRKFGFIGGLAALAAITIALFISSIYYAAT